MTAPHVILILLAAAILLPDLSKALSTSDRATLSFHHASVASSESLQDLIQSPSVSFVYFSGQDSPKIAQFLQQYDKAAKYLKIYNVTLVLYNCTSSLFDHDFCKKEASDNTVYTFQSGNELLPLTLEMLHDVDSIMANALQLVLLHQVPIIQSEMELQELQRDARGRRDVLFAYPAMFGTEDHRIFLEVAHTFHDRFQFALTTEVKVTQSLWNNKHHETGSRFSMWVLFCAESRSTDEVAGASCHSVVYADEISFAALAQFIKRLSERNLYHAPTDGVSHVFELSDMLPIVFLYASKGEQEQMASIIDFVKFDLRGYAKMVVVDMDSEECTAQAKQQGLAGKLPAVGIKQDGAMTFMDQGKELSHDHVQKFIRSVVFQENDQGFEPYSGITDSDEQVLDFDYSVFTDSVQRQDDQIAGAVFALHREEMELEYVPAFMKHDFYKTVPLADLKFVLFYLPFDHISMAFLREFGHAAEVLARNFSDVSVLAQVNCYDATDLCTAENITTYPVLRVYQKGQDHIAYTGSLDARSVIRAVKLWQLNGPVHLASEQQVHNFIKGEYPKSFHKFTPSSVLLLTSTENTDVESVFIKVSKAWSIVTAFGVVHDDVAKSVAKTYGVPVPSVLAFHRSDRIKPIRVLHEQLSEKALTNIVKNSVIYTVPRLRAMNLPTLFARKQPFVILFLDSSDPDSKVAKETFTQLAMIGQFDNVIFCWMDAQANTLGERILSEYTWSATLPMITLVDHGKGELFNYQPQLLTLEDTTEWLSGVLANKIRPSKMLQYAKWAPPGPHYDFLSMMDEMEKGEKQTVGPQFEDVPAIDINQEGTPEADSDRQKDFRQLQKPRLHRQNLERHDGIKKPYWMKEEPHLSHSHHHTEL